MINHLQKKRIAADKVKIYVRMRPLLNVEEWNSNLMICDDNSIRITKPDLDTTYMKFHRIFNAKYGQQDIFKSLDGSIQRFLEGENHSFFAYGQTGAGKTYTMIGEFQESNPFAPLPFLTSEHRGILPRALEKIVRHIKTMDRRCSLLGSFFEVYNEKVFDLLNPKTSVRREGLELREAKDGANKIVDLLKFDIRSVDDALQCLRVGLKNRITGCSHANTKSSRSHSIFQLVLIQDDEDDPTKKITSKLRIVDLAGSEKFKIPKDLEHDEKELHIAELTSINGSLSTLGHCITALAERKRTHIPFRNSKLTRVLSDSLSGESKITFIVCLSPSAESSNESLSTLQFASRAKKIVLDGRHIKKKEEALKNNIKLINKSNNVLELFKQLCSDQKVMNEVMDPSMYSKIRNLEQEIKELKVKNEELQSQVKELRRSYSPDPSYFKRSNESFSGSTRRQEKRSVSTNISIPYDDEEEDEDDNYHGVYMNRKIISSQLPSGAKSRRPSVERKVKFSNDFTHERGRSDIEYPENLFENLSIYKEMEKAAAAKKRHNGNEDSKNQKLDYLKFWSESKGDCYENFPNNNLEDQSLMNLINNSKPQPKQNLLAQKLKEKDIERKYEMFFALDKTKTPPPSNEQTPHNTLTKQDKPRWARRTQEEFVSPSPASLSFHAESVHHMELDQSLFNNHNEISVISHKRNQTIDELTEEGIMSDYKSSSSRKHETENNYRMDYQNSKRTTQSTNRSFEYLSCNSHIKTPREYDSHGLDIIQEFDKKLSSVHQLNEQHQNLIKSIGQKFGAWQQQDKPKESSRARKLQKSDSGDDKVIQTHSGRDVTQVVRDIKQELSDALTQINNLKLNTEHSASTQSLIHDARAQSFSDQVPASDKRSNLTDKSIDRYTWDDVRSKAGSPYLNLSSFYLKEVDGSRSSVNQSVSKSIGDIIKKHWSAYKENIQ